ncbi:hypothetical protein Esti_003819 [Eimeria stiedai]
MMVDSADPCALVIPRYEPGLPSSGPTSKKERHDAAKHTHKLAAAAADEEQQEADDQQQQQQRQLDGPAALDPLAWAESLFRDSGTPGAAGKRESETTPTTSAAHALQRSSSSSSRSKVSGGGAARLRLELPLGVSSLISFRIPTFVQQQTSQQVRLLLLLPHLLLLL